MSRPRREPPAPSRGGREVRAPRREGSGDGWDFPERDEVAQPPPAEDTRPTGQWDAVLETFEEAEQQSPLPPEPAGGRRQTGERRPRRERPRGRVGAAGDSVRPRRNGARARSRAVRSRRIAAVVVLVLIAALLAFLVALFQPFKGEGEGSVRVVVPKGATIGQIGDQLDRQGVVSSGPLFKLRAKLSGQGGDLQPGTYSMKQGMSYGAALDLLAAGPSKTTIQALVQEGLTRREIADSLDKQGYDRLGGGYVKASVRSPDLDPRDYGGRRSSTLEGFLFPATYELRSKATSGQLVSKQLATFKQQFSKVNLAYAKRKNLTRYDILVIASMIEREAQLDRERPKVAAVIYNRLKGGVPLGIDATTRYELNNWTRPLKASELQRDSPYNTRTRAGLPPGPIGNPGLASIRAAARPARVNYLYYVAKPCQSGEHVFTASDAAFQKAADRYQQVVKANGGRVPKKCR